MLDWEFLCVRLHVSPGGVLSKPGPEDLCASYPLGVCSVVVVSPSFRGVSCSVPRFPLLKKAFFRTSQLRLGRRREPLWPTFQVGPTDGTSGEMRVDRALDYVSPPLIHSRCWCIYNGCAVQRPPSDLLQPNRAGVVQCDCSQCNRFDWRRMADTMQPVRTPSERRNAAWLQRMCSERCRL